MTKKLEKIGKQAADALNEAVWHDLDKKQRLGHYAVIWENGKVARISPSRIRQLLKANPLPDNYNKKRTTKAKQ